MFISLISTYFPRLTSFLLFIHLRFYSICFFVAPHCESEAIGLGQSSLVASETHVSYVSRPSTGSYLFRPIFHSKFPIHYSYLFSSSSLSLLSISSLFLSSLVDRRCGSDVINPDYFPSRSSESAAHSSHSDCPGSGGSDSDGSGASSRPILCAPENAFYRCIAVLGPSDVQALDERTYECCLCRIACLGNLEMHAHMQHHSYNP